MIPPRPVPAAALCRRDSSLRHAPPANFLPSVIVAVTAQAGSLEHLTGCLASILALATPPDEVGVLVVCDVAGQMPEPLPILPTDLADRLWWVDARCGSAARGRNAGLAFVESEIPSARWVARLDVDDRFAGPESLNAMVAAGEAQLAHYVIGGNRVVSGAGSPLRLNPASQALRDPSTLGGLLEAMATGVATNELPSCNLLLATHQGIRYPDFKSAEDHWLVAALLTFAPERGAIVEAPLYADYTVNGEATVTARTQGAYQKSRRDLAAAARCWVTALAAPGEILGFGNEGVVRRHAGQVFKHFYPDALDRDCVERLVRLLGPPSPHAPSPTFTEEAGGGWLATYDFVETTPAETATEAQVAALLRWCLDRRVVFANVKRSNFRIGPDGSLVHVDVGKWVIPMDVSYFIDAAARMYAQFILGWDDDELLRRPLGPDHAWGPESVPGFSAFYRSVVTELAEACWRPARLPSPPLHRHDDVTLLVKACAMDAWYAREQITHIVDQLCGPARFHKRVVVIDPFEGPYTRQHDVGDLPRLRKICAELKAEGWIDEVWTAPLDVEAVSAVNERWFGLACQTARTKIGVPVAPQLWAFDQVKTRFVLQADLDVLIGRRDPSHDPVLDMVRACDPPDVLGVAFNIPHPPEVGWREYFAAPGDFVPEVRLGLMDLQRVRSCLPLPNGLDGQHLERTWYRSLQECQRRRGLRTVRGGDSRTFYVHPPNTLKSRSDAYHRVRDLVAQGRVPDAQLGRWDVEVPLDQWHYKARAESIAIYASGRDTPPSKIERFMAGLRAQEDQDFGVIVVDDAPLGTRRALQDQTVWLGDRVSLVRPARHQGRMANLVQSLRSLAVDPESLIVIVDLDDALMDPRAIGELKRLRAAEHDIVLAAPFRPDVPLQLYHPDFKAPRSTYGGDVWIHLRAFRRGLFTKLPDALLQDREGAWLVECTDYATMVPMVEMAEKPCYLPTYLYWHERTSSYATAASRESRDTLILDILSLPPVV